MTETQAMNFISRLKTDYLEVIDHAEAIQATAMTLSQEVTALGGVATVTSAISDENWNATYPFTKQEFNSIAADFGDLTDVLGEHDDLKANLVKLRE